MTPLQRQWEIVRLLAHGEMSVRDLRERFNVTQRTIIRDLNTIEAAGFELRERIERHGKKFYRTRRRIPPAE